MKFGLVVVLTVTAAGFLLAASGQPSDAEHDGLLILGGGCLAAALLFVAVPAIASGARGLGNEWRSLAREWTGR